MEYANNSVKNRENTPELPEKRVESVVSGDNVIKKKKTGFQKFVSAFVNDDVDDVGSWIVHDVLVPSLKRLIDDTVHGLLYSGERRRDTEKGRAYTGHVSYSSISKNGPQQQKPTGNSILDYDDVILNNRGDAEMLLYKLQEIVEEYGSASVADLYDLAGISHSFVFNKWGWSDLRSAQVVRVREGYLIKLPRIISLN